MRQPRAIALALANDTREIVRAGVGLAILFGLLLLGTCLGGCAAVAAATKEGPLVWESARATIEATPDGLVGQVRTDLRVFGVPVGLEVQAHTASGVVAVCAQVAGLPTVCAKYDGAIRLGPVLRPMPRLPTGPDKTLSQPVGQLVNSGGGP